MILYNSASRHLKEKNNLQVGLCAQYDAISTQSFYSCNSSESY